MHLYGIPDDHMAQVDGISKCTGVSKINSKFVIIHEGILMHLFEQKQKVKTLDLQLIENQDNNFFEFMCIIGISKINQP